MLPQQKNFDIVLQPKAGGSLTVKIGLDAEIMDRRRGGKAFVEMEG